MSAARRRVGVDHVGGRTFVVAVEGRLGPDLGAALTSVIGGIASRGAREVVLDLTGVSSLAITATDLLRDAEALLRGVGCQLAFVCDAQTPLTQRIVGCDSCARVAGDVPTALALLLRAPIP